MGTVEGDWQLPAHEHGVTPSLAPINRQELGTSHCPVKAASDTEKAPFSAAFPPSPSLESQVVTTNQQFIELALKSLKILLCSPAARRHSGAERFT